MPEEFFGDVVLYWGNSWLARVLEEFTESPISHCAVRISETEAESIDILEGLMKHDLGNPRDIYYAYAILQPKGITPEARESMKKIYEGVGKQYDFNRIWRLAWKHGKHKAMNCIREAVGKERKNFPQNLEDITTDSGSWSHLIFNKVFLTLLREFSGFHDVLEDIRGNGSNLQDCSSLYAMIDSYSPANKTILQGVHHSQIEPHQIYNLEKYSVVQSWIRNGFEEHENVRALRRFPLSSNFARA